MSDPAPRPRTAIERSRDRAFKHPGNDGRRAYAKGMLQGIASMLGPRDVVVDCGANMGAVTEILADTGARVHAFEPDPYTFAKLQAGMAGRANVTCHAAAVGAVAGTFRLQRAEGWAANPDGASVSSSIVAGGRRMADAEGVEVTVIDFLAFLRGLVADHGRVAFVKIDIEGAELELLEAMEGTDLFDHIQLLVAETHEKKFAHLAPRFAALRARMAARFPITRVNLDWI